MRRFQWKSSPHLCVYKIHKSTDFHRPTLIFLFLVGILRLQDGCDYSALISKEEQIIIPENAGDTEAEIEKEKANKDDNSDDVEQGKGLNLSKLVQTCPNLSKLVQTCPS